MNATGENNAAGFPSRYIAAVLILFALWLVLTGVISFPGGLRPGAMGQELLAGAAISLLLGFWAAGFLARSGLAVFSPKRLFALAAYVPVFFIEVVKANLDVAYRVIHPAMPIRPGIVAVKTSLKSDIAKLWLANSITLTPGTLTVDVVGDTLFIHWIYVRSDDVEGATQAIVSKFEKYIRMIVE